MMKKAICMGLGVLFVFILTGASIAGAALWGPEWPAPGGTIYSASGNQGAAGGLTFSYTGFNPTSYGKLYWGPWEGATIGASLNGTGISGSEVMTFGGFTGNKAVWTGSSTWSYYSGGGSYSDQAIQTRMTLTVSQPAFLDASALGKGSIGVLAQVTGDYTANILFEANFFGNWLPLNQGYDRYQTVSGVQTWTEFSGGFYHTPVPVPAAFWLLGSGLLGLAGFRRKFKK